MVFPDHTTCTDPGNIVGGGGGGGGVGVGVGGSRPIRHKFFQSTTEFTVLFKENYTFSRLQRGSNIFRGGGGGEGVVQTLARGGGGGEGGSKYKNPNNL